MRTRAEKSAEYVLGGSAAELQRLRAQAAEHDVSARRLLAAVGLERGCRVLDDGCAGRSRRDHRSSRTSTTSHGLASLRTVADGDPLELSETQSRWAGAGSLVAVAPVIALATESHRSRRPGGVVISFQGSSIRGRLWRMAAIAANPANVGRKSSWTIR